MNYALVVSAAPDALLQPLHFARAVLDGGHVLQRVFFLRDGVRHGALEGDALEQAAASAWLALQTRAFELELALCVGAAGRRAVAAATGDGVSTFIHVGLGQLVAALESAERVISFPAAP